MGYVVYSITRSLIDMSVVSAFLVPGSPLPKMQPDSGPWGQMAQGFQLAGKALARSAPDAVVIYSTQWIAVLDQLWQTRPRLKGSHVDENWHEYGDLPFDITVDVDLAGACIKGTAAAGLKAKGVDYDQFPVDTGTIVANGFLNTDGKPLVIASNNVYHDWSATEHLGKVAASAAELQDKNIAVVAVGGLSGSFFRKTIDPAADRISSDSDDHWNRRVLDLVERGETEELLELVPDYVSEARVDMGFKHFAFVLGALNNQFSGATVHHYGPLYGAGGAVIEFGL